MAVITISRLYGSGGDEIAQKVCQMLGYRYFEKRHIAQVASEMGLSEEQVVDFSEDKHKMQGFLERLFGRARPVAQVRVWREDTHGVRTLETTVLDEIQASNMVEAAILMAYKEGNIVIMGRGSQVVLRDKPGVLHIRIEAPLEVRAQRIKDQEITDLATAREKVVQRDAIAADFLKRFYNVDWADPMLYHMVINTGKIDVETAAQLIVNAVKLVVTDSTKN